MTPPIDLRTRLGSSCSNVMALQEWVRDNNGSSLLEFAVALSVLFTAILGIIYGSMALFADHYVAAAARDGARYAMVRGSSWGGVACASAASYNCTATTSAVRAYLISLAPPGLTAANTAVATTWPGTTAAGGVCFTANGLNGIGCSVIVTVTYTFNLSLPLLPKKSLQLTSSSTMPITQ